MITIHKFELKPNLYTQSIEMPKESVVMGIQVQRGKPVIYARVNTELPLENRVFFNCTTGSLLKGEFKYQFVGTYQLDDGDFVGHVFVL